MWLNYSQDSDEGVFTFQVMQRVEGQTLDEAADEGWQNAVGRVETLELVAMERFELEGSIAAIRSLGAFQGPERSGLILTITAFSETHRLVGMATVYTDEPRRLLALAEAAAAIARSIRPAEA